MPCRISDAGVGFIGTDIDVDARTDKQTDRIQAAATRSDMQCRETLAFDSRVDAVIEHRCKNACVACVCRFEPYSGIDAIGFARGRVTTDRRVARRRLAGGQAGEQQCCEGPPETGETH